jgi:hypothetical protein
VKKKQQNYRVPHRSPHNAIYSSIFFVAMNFSTTPTTLNDEKHSEHLRKKLKQ